MGKNRLETFSDGVLAIIITIMVLELKVPHGDSLTALSPLIPVFFGYLLSFIYIAIYWNNHHHLMHTVGHVSASILWANMHLLFWLSLIPFATAWMGENHFSATPTALYGFILLMAGFAYWLLGQAIIRSHGPDALLAKAVGNDLKGKGSLALYLLAIPLAFYQELLADAIYVLVAIWWLLPDRRIERMLQNQHQP
ncbi:MAG: TMEM175 family protein [Arenimonas sp.]|uniref:TMEM175 family protein n=1 Tax=Arenimonas sp. TaxID=1872635 RepID=UPI003BFA88C4